MAFFQGSPLPNVTETTTDKQVAPDYYTSQLENLQRAGQTAMGRTGAESVAGYDPLQDQGYGALPSAATSYQPGLSAAQQTAATAARGITPERIQALMNPYTTNVVDEMARLSQQNVQRNLLPTMKAGFVGTGGLGSQRYANALGQSMADVQAGLTGQQYGALSKGYSEALKGALDEAQLQNLTARTQGDLAKTEQDLALTGAGALTKAGAERQAYEQSILDAPMKTAKAASDLMRGYTVPLETTKTFVGPRTRDYYQTSDMARAGGVLSLLGAAAPGLSNLLPSQVPGLSNFLSGKSNYLDLGGGISISLDSRGVPTVSGGVSNPDYIPPGNDDLLRSWGFVNVEGPGGKPTDSWLFADDTPMGG
jgi:hypothetical protein